MARRKVVMGNLLDWSMRMLSESRLVTAISIQLPRSGMIRAPCSGRSDSWNSLVKSTPGERCICETSTRSAPLTMNSPPPIMIGISPR